MRAPFRLPLDRTAIVFVDLQEEHRKDSRFLAEGYEAVVANAARLQAAARAAKVPLLHCAFVVDMAAGDHHRFHPVSPDGRSAFSDSADPLTAICPEVAPREGETLVVKTAPSGFANGRLDAALEKIAPEWLIVCGAWTEACVYETVKDAQRRGFRVLLVKDACASGTATMHQAAVLNLANRLYGGAVATTDAACRLLAREEVVAWQPDRPVPFRYDAATIAELYASL